MGKLSHKKTASAKQAVKPAPTRNAAVPSASKTPLGAQLRSMRPGIAKTAGAPLTWDGVREEVRSRRGESAGADE
jgi:hypothetical protein